MGESLRIERVRSRAGLADFAGVLAGLDGDWRILRFYEATAAESLAEESRQLFFVGYWEEQAVACCELMLGPGGVAGLYGVATLLGYRRRGFATAMVEHAVGVARDLGMLRVVVEPSEEGAGLYRRLGLIC